MKKVAGNLRIDLAQYREMEVFSQFSSDLDPATKELLDTGDRIMELLKQPLLNPLPLYAQVLLLTVSKNRMLLDIPINEIVNFKSDFIDFVERKAPGIIKTIIETKALSDEDEEKIIELCKEFKTGRYVSALADDPGEEAEVVLNENNSKED